METNENDLSPVESLQLIRSMISKAKTSVADNSFYLLFWGWLVFACCISQYLLKVVIHYPNHFYVWLLMPFGGIVSGIYSSRQAKKQIVRTFAEEALDYLWMGLALSFIVLVIINMTGKGWQGTFSNFILLYAIGTFVTGNIIRFRPLVIGGIINFVLAAVCIHFDYDSQLLIAALALLTSYIIPGHMLRISFKKNQK